MRFQFWTVLFALALAAPVRGQCDTAILDSADAPPVSIEVEPKGRLSSRIVFVVDVSGSMKGRKIDQALTAVQEVLSQPLDDVEVAVYAFDEKTHHWPGHRGPGDEEVPEGWGRLPSAETVGSIQAWLRGLGAANGTNPMHAMASAINEAREDLSVILVSDGVFSEWSWPLVGAVSEAQKAREAVGLRPALVMVYGVGRDAAQMEWLRRIGEAGGGGLIVER